VHSNRITAAEDPDQACRQIRLGYARTGPERERRCERDLG
jgi:hypothetical protein